MEEDQIKKISQQEINKNAQSSRFSFGGTQRHVHNGLDSPPISAVNLIYNAKTRFGFLVSDATDETITVQVPVSNATQLYASGIIRTPVSGVATTKGTFFSVAELGNCYTQATPEQNSLGEKLKVMQICTGTQFTGSGYAQQIALTGNLSVGATSATLSSNWTFATSSYVATFTSGEVRTVILTNGATTMTWANALTIAASSNFSYGQVFTPTVYTDPTYFICAPNYEVVIWIKDYTNTTITFGVYGTAAWSATGTIYVT
jgi:hypothetical protein